jgi:hypothetical protein
MVEAFGHRLLDCRLEYERKVVKEAFGVVAHQYTHTRGWWGVLSVRKTVFTCLQT